jgi:cation diffusion facilitator CzcD-associated flavoprotein CzcO
MSTKTGTHDQPATRYDAIVVGAGFSGLRVLHEIRRLGLSVRVLEAASDVGGTWHWNRYPGARTDSESWVYCFSFDKDLQNDWDWEERYPSQREVEHYLQHVADRFDMRKDIEFSTRVETARYDDNIRLWTVTTDRGQTFECSYFVCGTGLLSMTNQPPFPGLDSFAGEWYQTSDWPTHKVDFADKRVAVIGTGSSGVQVIPIIAHTADRLTVYQRTPNFVLPGRNRVLEEEERTGIKTNYEAIWKLCREQVFGFPIESPNRVSGDLSSADEFEQVLEAGWEAGGFRYLFETFDDLLVDPATNERAAEFVRRKIRAIVKDPKTAEALCPTYPIGGKRPPLGYWYYETFNRPNIELVSIKENPIEAVTTTGIRLADGTEQQFDVIVFALGFDAITGAMSAMDIQGRDGRTIRDEWSRRTNNYLGVTVEGFPNLFMLFGPGCAFANAPVLIDFQAHWIGQAIAKTLEGGGGASIEPTVEAVSAWGHACEQAAQATVIDKAAASANSWFVGANIAGKRQAPLVYFGALSSYTAELTKEVDSGFPNVLKI